MEISINNFIERQAYNFARYVHKNQIRKFSGKSYFDEHIVPVYLLVKEYNGTLEERITALLHDTIEDTNEKTHINVTNELILCLFGKTIADKVRNLTSDPEQIEILGKTDYLIQKMLKMDDSDFKIKLADRCCNCTDLPTAPEKFKLKYFNETEKIISNVCTRNLTEEHSQLINSINLKIYSLKFE